jgi:hypothetical protein
MERAPLPELKITNDRLLVFVDDTGHEAFKGAHNYYGLGGCVVLGAHYEWMKTQWREGPGRQYCPGAAPSGRLHIASSLSG